VKRRLTQRRQDAKKGNNDLLLDKEETGRALRALRLCETLPFFQREKAAHAKAPRRKERQERLPSWDRRNGRALRLCGFARPCRCFSVKRRLTQRRKDAKKGKKCPGTQALPPSPIQPPQARLLWRRRRLRRTCRAAPSPDRPAPALPRLAAPGPAGIAPFSLDSA